MYSRRRTPRLDPCPYPYPYTPALQNNPPRRLKSSSAAPWSILPTPSTPSAPVTPRSLSLVPGGQICVEVRCGVVDMEASG